MATVTQNGSATLTENGLQQQTKSPNKPKKLIVCCDGTWQDADNKPNAPTNVSRLARAICTEDDGNHQQIVYYQAGVGTGLGLWSQLIGGGTGAGLAAHVREAYAFLANNFSTVNQSEKADSIFLIGFSRGAFTARSIGGLLGAVGLLTKKAMPLFHEVYSDWQYAGRREPRFFDCYFEGADGKKPDLTTLKKLCQNVAAEPLARNIDTYMQEYKRLLFKLDLSRDCRIECIGVFDTVGALGIPVHPWIQRVIPHLPALREYSWFDTRIGNHVKNGFHALALDEKRAPFHPTLWEREKDDTTYIKQVWFPGAHSDIGGGYDQTGPADITLTWMMDHLSGRNGNPDAETGPEHWIKFDPDFINECYDKRRKAYLRGVELGTDKKMWPPWACGIINDSFRFPHNLLGSRVRTPGRYHFTNYVTGAEQKRLLTRTFEFIHPSVRVRMQLGGPAVSVHDTKAASHSPGLFASIGRAYYWANEHLRREHPYTPMAKGQPLQAWRLDDQNAAPLTREGVETEEDGKVLWTHIEPKGKIEQQDAPSFITEERMSHYQKMLKELDSSAYSVLVEHQPPKVAPPSPVPRHTL